MLPQVRPPRVDDSGHALEDVSIVAVTPVVPEHHSGLLMSIMERLTICPRERISCLLASTRYNGQGTVRGVEVDEKLVLD